jgi:hypothetical protein
MRKIEFVETYFCDPDNWYLIEPKDKDKPIFVHVGKEQFERLKPLQKELENDFGMAHIVEEGAPIHPDDLSYALTDKQYKKQLHAYNKHHGIKRCPKTPTG